MSDALTKGSERLAQVMWKFDEWDRDNTISIIAADPGVKALVEFVRAIADAGFNVPAQHALKLWARGNE